jgi:predicted DNA-binding transcriptional regulator AlpA
MSEISIASIAIPLTEWREVTATLKAMSQKVDSLLNERNRELLTPKEVCEMLKIGRTTFDRYVSEGLIMPERISKKKYSKVLIRRTDIEAGLKEGRF